MRLFFVQPFDQSCRTGLGALGAAFATGVMVARLRTINAPRIKYVIKFILISLVGRDVRLRNVDAFTRHDNPCPVDWIYAVSAEVWPIPAPFAA